MVFFLYIWLLIPPYIKVINETELQTLIHLELNERNALNDIHIFEILLNIYDTDVLKGEIWTSKDSIHIKKSII
jgi:hypothetical protein